MTSHRFRILACFCLSLGLSNAVRAQSLVETSRVERLATDPGNDSSEDIHLSNQDVDLVGYITDGVGVQSGAEGLFISGTIYQLVGMFPMSAGTVNLYGELWRPESSGMTREVSTAYANSLESELQAPILEFALAPVTPNPSYGSVRLAWAVPRSSQVHIAIHDVQGRQITVLADGEYAPGRYEAVWNAFVGGRQNAPGIYFIRMQTPERAFMRRVVLIP